MKQLLASGARFSLTSAVCTALNLVILIAGDAAGLHYLASASASFVVCVLVGYGLHCRFTFVQTASLTGLLRYALAMALNFPLLVLSIWLLHDRMGLPMVWGAPLCTAISFCFNYLASRWAIHRRLAAHD